MQLIWYLPSLIIGLALGFSNGYWQLALISVLMVTMMLGLQIYRRRYPQFESGASIHLSAGQAAINNRALPRYELFWKKQWHELLVQHFQSRQAPNYLGQVLAQKLEKGFCSESNPALALWLGASTASEISIDLATEGPHLLIVGPTGSGKSELLKLIVGSILETQRADLALFDFKGGATLEKFLPAAIGIGTDLDPHDCEKLLDHVFSELAVREKMFAEQAVSNLSEFNLAGNQLRPLVVVIDEFAAVLASGAKAASCIEAICARGRSLGVHLIAASQSLTGISRSLLTNLRARIAMQSSDPIDFVQLGMNPNKANLLAVEGFGSAVLLTSVRAPEAFYFPLGFMPVPKQEALMEADEPQQLARSQLLRQMYSDPEPKPDPPAEQPSSQDSQLLSRMEALRLSERR